MECSRGFCGGPVAAANYTLSQWRKLTRFLEHAELELSNNLAENSMRPVAVGRKNWIHIGSQQDGHPCPDGWFRSSRSMGDFHPLNASHTEHSRPGCLSYMDASRALQSA